MTHGDRLTSGQPHLDAIFEGGLPRNAINMLIGPPGSGKTMLAEQYVFRNSSPERPAIYFTTASEPLDKLVRYAQRLDFFDVGAIGQAIFFDDLGPVLQESGLSGALDRILAAIRDRRPGMIVIDSFKALRTYADDALSFRRFVTELAGRLSGVAVDVFWVGEYDPREVGREPEFAVADTIVSLGSRHEAERTTRRLEVIKLRGSPHLSGAHAYRLSSHGLHVFPRLADARDDAPYQLRDGRLPTGVVDLDEMLGGGLWPGSATLVAGPSGSGKTLMGLQFLRTGAVDSERNVYATLQENPTQIERVADGFGWSLDRVDVLYRSPVDVYIDEWVYDLLDLVDRTGAARVVIDSLNDLRVAARDDTRFHEYVYSLIQRFSRSGTTVLMTNEVQDMFGGPQASDSKISHLADNVILLTYRLGEDAVERSMIVVKARATRHDQSIRRFEIGPSGITSLEPARRH